MKNWIKVTPREINRFIAERGMNVQAARNFRFMVNDCHKKGFTGMFFVNCKCVCGRNHENLLLIKKFDGNMKDLYENDRSPKTICKICTVGVQTLHDSGIRDKEQVAELLGWKKREGAG